MKKFVGAHVSSSGGVFNAVYQAQEIGAKAFAVFTKNQKRWEAKPLDDKTINKFKLKIQSTSNLAVKEDINFVERKKLDQLKDYMCLDNVCVGSK